MLTDEEILRGSIALAADGLAIASSRMIFSRSSRQRCKRARRNQSIIFRKFLS